MTFLQAVSWRGSEIEGTILAREAEITLDKVVLAPQQLNACSTVHTNDEKSDCSWNGIAVSEASKVGCPEKSGFSHYSFLCCTQDIMRTSLILGAGDAHKVINTLTLFVLPSEQDNPWLFRFNHQCQASQAYDLYSPALLAAHQP